jgi:hypothetical protein
MAIVHLLSQPTCKISRGTALAARRGMCRSICAILLLVSLPGLPTRPPVVTHAASDVDPLTALWEEPRDLARKNLFDGPWGRERAPDPRATYLFLRAKARGINPGVVLEDPAGRVWHVKQHGHNDAGAEGPVEVVISRVLSAVGYHQPPVYFLPSFKMTDGIDTRVEPGGRFRLEEPALQELGSWSWQGPFAGTRPAQGLLAILLLFNSTDLKDSNNTIYGVHGRAPGREPRAPSRWYVVRDLGAALGETARFSPRGDDAAMFERSRFIVGFDQGFALFANRSAYQSLFQRRLSRVDVAWAGRLLARLTDRQWRDAFRAGGYTPEASDRFIRKICANVEEARRLGTEWR